MFAVGLTLKCFLVIKFLAPYLTEYSNNAYIHNVLGNSCFLLFFWDICISKGEKQTETLTQRFSSRLVSQWLHYLWVRWKLGRNLTVLPHEWPGSKYLRNLPLPPQMHQQKAASEGEWSEPKPAILHRLLLSWMVAGTVVPQCWPQVLLSVLELHCFLLVWLTYFFSIFF